MNKEELLTEMAKKTKLTKKDCSTCLEAFMNTVTEALKDKKDGSLALIGFGTFKTAERKARKGRNPQTGKEIKIAASTAVKFSVGKKLKDAVNGNK